MTFSLGLPRLIFFFGEAAVLQSWEKWSKDFQGTKVSSEYMKAWFLLCSTCHHLQNSQTGRTNCRFPKFLLDGLININIWYTSGISSSFNHLSSLLKKKKKMLDVYLAKHLCCTGAAIGAYRKLTTSMVLTFVFVLWNEDKIFYMFL